MKYCINCGAEIPENAKFCPECGEPVLKRDENNKVVEDTYARKQETEVQSDMQTDKEPVGKAPSGKKKKTIIIIAVIAAIAVAAGLIFYFAKASEEKITLKNPEKLSEKNITGTWELVEDKDKTTIEFAEKKKVSIESTRLENSKEFSDGNYKIEKDHVIMTFKPEKSKKVKLEVKAGVNKDSLQIICDDEDYKALNGIYKKTESAAEVEKETVVDKDEPEEPEKTEELAKTKKPDITRDQVISVYKSKLSSLNGENMPVEVIIYDITGDGIPEMIGEYGTCEANYTYIIDTIDDKDPSKTRLLGKTHAGHTGLFLYKGELYSHYMQMGVQSIDKVTFNPANPEHADTTNIYHIEDRYGPDQNIYDLAGMPEDQIIILNTMAVTPDRIQ